MRGTEARRSGDIPERWRRSVHYARRVPELDELLAMANSSDSRERVAAITTLGRFSDPAARAAVVRALYDPEDTAVTEAAVAVLVKRGGTADADALLAALTEGDEETSLHVYGFLNARGFAFPFAQAVLDRYREKTVEPS
jgi:HEAT repeat protein